MTIRKPEITINLLSYPTKERNQEQKILFVGQGTVITVPPGSLVEDIGNNNEQYSLFGRQCLLSRMITSAKQINKVTRMDAICLEDDIATVSATGNIIFSGTATEAGTFYVTVGSVKNHRYEINVTNTETATAIGTALETAINNDLYSFVDAINTSGDVRLDAANGGTEGNYVGLKVEGNVAGITVSITSMSGGLTNPDLTGLFNVINNNRYQTIVYPSSFDLIPLLTLLDNRWNISNNVLDGVGCITVTDTVANLKTLGNGKNTQSLQIIANKLINETNYKGSQIFEFDSVISAEFAAVRALRLTQGADISRYVISTYGVRDVVGGAAIASLPYFNTSFYNLPLIDTSKEFTDTEISELKNAGISVLGNNPAKDTIIAGEMVTTYKRDVASNDDPTFKYLEYVDTASNIREYFYNNLRSRFAQSRLTNGDVQPNRNMANAAIIGAYCDGLYNDLGSADYVLTRIGKDPETGIDFLTFFKNNRTVTLDLEIGLASIIMIVPIVTQLRSIYVEMQIDVSTNS